jgi:hypothetical protein
VEPTPPITIITGGLDITTIATPDTIGDYHPKKREDP